MEFTKYEHGVPCWVDVSCDDIEKSAQFYSELFGWDVPEGDPTFGGYRNAKIDGKTVAGIAPKMDAQMPSAWSCYVKTDDIADTTSKVEAAGGTVLAAPMEVGPLGSMAFYIDPTGAVVGAWQPGLHIGAELANVPNTFCWSELITSDVAAAKAFYASVFGWGEHSSEGPMPYTEWEVDGRTVGGAMAKPPMMPPEVPSFWNIYFAVADLDAALAKATELGATPTMPTMDTPAGRVAGLQEPNGAAFSLIQLAPDRH